jgi:hypothetical protein
MKTVIRMLWCVWLGAVSALAELPSASLDSEDFFLEFADGHVVRSTELRSVPEARPGLKRWELKSPALMVLEGALEAPAGCRRRFLEVRNTGFGALSLVRVVLADFPAPAEARVAGECGGSPVVAGVRFWGVEHPFAENRVAAGRVRCALPIMLPLSAGESVRASFVSGEASEPSQLRRAFAAYLEWLRPRRNAPFLLHNTWYNLGYSSLYSEADELALIATLGRELVERRGVRIDAFVLDDGWDDTRTLWRFHAGWPTGLGGMRKAAAQLGAAPGIWMSPWGGYNAPKRERLAAAAPEGFEVRDGGFSLAGPRYYQRFRELCLQALKEGGVRFFKFDGIGSTQEGVIDPAAGRDFDAMLRLIAELRERRPGLYVSQTVGTWPSPWWLLHVDNIWRGGEDHGFAGEGSDRRQWITYRDAQVYSRVVRRAPLFPLNALMLHGIILARHAERLASPGDEAFREEVRSFFGSGVQLQELYLSPELLSAADWDLLAESAKWARANASVLGDAHWIGGDPEKLEPYGWAAWNEGVGLVTLRNPSGHETTFGFEPKEALQLPAGALGRFRVKPVYPDSPVPFAQLEAGKPMQIRLKPFEVLVLRLEACAP